eukprot:11326109-Karenia_brevis.AAC.1
MSSALVTRVGWGQKRTSPRGTSLRSWQKSRKPPWAAHAWNFPGVHGEPKMSMSRATCFLHYGPMEPQSCDVESSQYMEKAIIRGRCTRASANFDHVLTDATALGNPKSKLW